MTTHPNSLALEAFACGEASPLAVIAAAHVATCSACGAFVEALRRVVAGGPSRREAEAVVARAAKRATGEDAHEHEHAHEHARTTGSQDTSRRVLRIASGVVAPLAMAAAILLLLRRPAQHDVGDHVQPSVVAPVTVPTTAVDPAAAGLGDPDTTFKGAMQIAVVRDRAGEQARFSAAVPVRQGDRLRVEVALDREQAILGAVLGDDGSYLEVMPLAVRGAGTHLSERSAKIDGRPTYGTIVIGSPEAVARARATKRFEGVVTQRVEWDKQ